MENYYVINTLRLVDSCETIEEGDMVNIVATNGTCFQCWKVEQISTSGLKIDNDDYGWNVYVLFEDIESMDLECKGDE